MIEPIEQNQTSLAPANDGAPAAAKRERPVDQKKAAAAAAKKRMKRAFEKALESDDPEALERMAAAMAGGAPASSTASAPAASESTALAVAAPPPGPSPEDVAAMTQLASGLVASLAGALEGTRYDPMKARPNPVGGEDIVPAKAITEALGVVLAKYVPAVVTTPEGQLALVLGMWLVPPTLELAAEKFMGGDDGAVGAGVKAAS